MNLETQLKLETALQNKTTSGESGHHGANAHHVFQALPPHTVAEFAQHLGAMDLLKRNVPVKVHSVQPGKLGQNGQNAQKLAETANVTDHDFACTVTIALDHQRIPTNVKTIHHAVDGLLGVNGVRAAANVALDKRLVNVSATMANIWEPHALDLQHKLSNAWIVHAANGQIGINGCRATEAAVTANNIVYVNARDLEMKAQPANALDRICNIETAIRRAAQFELKQLQESTIRNLVSI